MSLHSFPDPTTQLHQALLSLKLLHSKVSWNYACVAFCVCLFYCVHLHTLTNTALGVIVVDVANIAQAVVAALFIFTTCCSTHTRVLTLIHIWKDTKHFQLDRSQSGIKETAKKLSCKDMVWGCYLHLCCGNDGPVKGLWQINLFLITKYYTCNYKSRSRDRIILSLK